MEIRQPVEAAGVVKLMGQTRLVVRFETVGAGAALGGAGGWHGWKDHALISG